MKLMLYYIKKYTGMFLTAVVFLIIETFADLLQPTFMSYIVDRGVKGQEQGLILRYGLILLIRDGRIAERGTHRQLMALDGEYAQMYLTQMGRI